MRFRRVIPGRGDYRRGNHVSAGNRILGCLVELIEVLLVDVDDLRGSFRRGVLLVHDFYKFSIVYHCLVRLKRAVVLEFRYLADANFSELVYSDNVNGGLLVVREFYGKRGP